MRRGAAHVGLRGEPRGRGGRVAHASPRELKTGRETIKIEPVCDATVVGNFHRLYERTVFFCSDYPLRYSINLIDSRARSIF